MSGIQQLRDKVAVITGGASGIGRDLARAFGAEGMRLALADIEESALETAVKELRADGVDAIGVRTDVTSFDSVDALAAAVYDEYGVVHVLCNNAGVGPPSAAVWSTTPNDWRWTFSVNVFGVAHGIQAFVPRMLEGGQEGVVVNTSSPDGPISPMPQASVYAATKASVTVLTECLDAQLRADGTELWASVFYPSGNGLLDTGLWTSDRNRPDELARERPRDTPAMTVAALAEQGIPIQPLEALSDVVVAGIKDGRFALILPGYEIEEKLRGRLDKILANENPTEVHALGA